MRFELSVCEYLLTGQVKVVKVQAYATQAEAERAAESFRVNPRHGPQRFHAVVRDKRRDYQSDAAIVHRIGDVTAKGWANARRWEYRASHGADYCVRAIVGEAVA